MYHNPPYPPEELEDYPPPYPRPNSNLKLWLWILGGVLGIGWFLGLHSGKNGGLETLPIPPNHLEVQSHVERQVENTLPLVYTTQDGELKRVLANATAYSEFVRVHSENLEQARKRLHQQTVTLLGQRLDEVFTSVDARTERFADWYFAYGTSYTLLWETLTSVARHAGEESSLKDLVATDLEAYLQTQYRNLVLKPELTGPHLHRAYSQTLESMHQAYLNILAVMQADFQVFVAEHTTHVENFSSQTPELKLDWHTQFSKIGHFEEMKTSLGGIRGISLAAIGGISGKALGMEAGKILFPKLVTPFVNKGLSAAAGGTTGGGLGSLGGPLGAILGTATGIGAGLGLDMLVNEGVELMNRDEFLVDTRNAISATRTEWEEVLAQSSTEAVDVWFTDTLQLLPQYDQQNTR